MHEHETLLVSEQRMREVLLGILLKNGVPVNKANTCAEVFTTNTLEGVSSHGINRFQQFVTSITKGIVKTEAEPVCTANFGAIEQWHGNSGIGITNALACTQRTMELAVTHGIGCVALSHTNHWMRAGTYARHAAANGFALIAWSNTIGNTPAWGAEDPRLGNNPLTIGVPYGDAPVVLDMAMSQFSYGALKRYSMNNETLPVPGGFTKDGDLSTDPDAILESKRTLPIGYWKGSGLSVLLDMLATVLSGGLSVSEISKQAEETNVSQVFIAFNMTGLKNSFMHEQIEKIVNDLKQSKSDGSGPEVRYPGENISAVRAKNLVNGIPVSRNVWNEVVQVNN